MTRSHLRFLVKPLMLLSVVMLFSLSNPLPAGAMDVGGVWETNWGQMVLEQFENHVTGTYATSGGRIYGKMHGNVLEGYWTQTSAGQACSTSRNGSRHWGSLRFDFTPDGRFSGTWGYCDKAPSSGGWKGKRVSGGAPQAPAAAGAGTGISGTWDSNWGVMAFDQSGSRVTGTYATKSGRIFGTMSGSILEGYWTQTSSGRKCTSEKHGSRYWGRLRFEFDPEGRFSGKWGYCDSAPSSGGWSGKRR